MITNEKGEMGFNTARLRFKCTGCGDCCRRPGEVRFGDETLEAIANHLGLEIEEFRVTYHLSYDEGNIDHWVLDVVNNEPCPFLEDNRCSIHPVRPRQCRTYPFWPEILGSRWSWQEEKRDCPGIDNGPLISECDLLALLEAETNQVPVSQLVKVKRVSDDS